MSLKVSQLIRALSEMDPDAPVRIAYQSSWPLQMEVMRDLAFRTGRDGQKSVYLLGGEQPYNAPYAPTAIFDGEHPGMLEEDDESEMEEEDMG